MLDSFASAKGLTGLRVGDGVSASDLTATEADMGKSSLSAEPGLSNLEAAEATEWSSHDEVVVIANLKTPPGTSGFLKS